jgi:NAD(P)-dependent dehydrogenase (short-subunit alcohol dehydrogenase family)
MYTLITGVSRGLGHGTARALAAKGWPLVVTARSLAAAQGLAETLGGQTLGFALDVTEASQHQALATELQRRGVALSCVLHNAAVYERSSDPAAAARTLATNVLGPVHLTHTLLPLLTPTARIVLVSSGLGSLHSGYSPAMRARLEETSTRHEVEVLVSEYLAATSSATSATASADAAERAGFSRDPYGVSKALVNALARAWSLEFPLRTVVAVSPGWVRTDMGGAKAPRDLGQGADSILWPVLQAGPDVTGGFFRDGERLAW